MSDHVIMHFDGREWGAAKRHRSLGPPLDLVRELLQGRWTRSTGHIERDGAAAFWNATNGRRVLVMTETVARKLVAEVRS